MERNIHVQPYADITREANTATYAAGDVIAASTSAAVASVFGRCSRSNVSRGGVIHSVTLISSSNPTLKLDGDLFLFNVAPVTFGNDNAAFAPTDAEMLNLVAAIAIDGTAAGNLFIGLSGAAGAGNVGVVVKDLHVPFECAENDGSLYGVLVARNAYVPITAEAIRIKLGIEQG